MFAFAAFDLVFRY